MGQPSLVAFTRLSTRGEGITQRTSFELSQRTYASTMADRDGSSGGEGPSRARPTVEKEALKEVLAEMLNEIPAFKEWAAGKKGKGKGKAPANPADMGPAECRDTVPASTVVQKTNSVHAQPLKVHKSHKILQHGTAM